MYSFDNQNLMCNFVEILTKRYLSRLRKYYNFILCRKSLDEMSELFQRNKSTISRHIKNIFDEGELDKKAVVANYATTTHHGTPRCAESF